MSDKTNAVFEALADQLVEAIESNPGDWSKPWREAIGNGIPANAVTGATYKGGNTWVLALSHAAGGGPVWATYNQWKSVGVQVAKGSKAVTLVKWFTPRCKAKHPKEVRCGACPKGLFPTAFSVFHADQTEGGAEWIADRYPPAEPPAPGERIDHVEAFIAATGATILHSSPGAFYSPKGDFVNVPCIEQFTDPVRYYGTVLHELTHWTGHRSRCNRVGIAEFDRFGSEQYAAEELIAELGSVLLGVGILGIDMPVREDHAAYLASWVRVLKATPKALYTALTKSSAAANYLVDLTAAAEAPVEDLVAA